MARLFCILALVAMCSIAAFAQQVVPCTYPSTDFSGGRNRYVGAGGSVSSSIPSSITSRSVSCWQLDGFASQGAALSPGETTSPASPLIQLPLSSATSTTVASSVCSTDAAIYGKVREISLTGTTDNCSVTAQVFSRTSAPDNGQGRLGIGSDNGCNYSAKYRLDGSGACPGNSISQSFALTSASGKSLSSMGDTFEITLGTDGGSIPVVSLTIDVYGQSATDKATITFPIDKNTNSISTAENYIIPFASFSGSQTAFSNTGAIEVTFGGADVDALMFFFDVIQNPTTNVGATVFVDCGCNGFQQGSGDSLQANVPVTLNVAGAGCTASSQTVNTNSQGSVSFTNLPAGCTYTLSVSGQNLCTNSPTSQSVASGGSASFAIQGAAGGLVIPTDRTVNCGTDTSPTTTGSATSGTGQCGSGTGTPQFTDVVTPQTCSAPGGTLSVIKRTWTLNGSSQTQTITVVDTRTIALQGVPTGSTLNCNDPIPTAAVTGVACTAVTVTNNQNNVVGTCDTTTCTQTGSVTVTYTGRDVCGNTATRTVTYQRNGCAPSCPPPSTPPPPPPNAPPPPTQLPTNANCRFICDDDDSSAVHLMVSAVLAVVLALVAAF